MADYMDALHFAEDLMKFALSVQDIPWLHQEIICYNKNRSPFNEDIGDAVLSIIEHNMEDILGALRDLTEMGARTTVLFSRYAFEAAPIYFPKGYSHERMLCYCAMLVGVGRLLFEYPLNGIPQCTSNIIGTVLTGHILTGEFQKQGGYERLSEVSEMISSRLAGTLERNAAEQIAD